MTTIDWILAYMPLVADIITRLLLAAALFVVAAIVYIGIDNARSEKKWKKK